MTNHESARVGAPRPVSGHSPLDGPHALLRPASCQPLLAANSAAFSPTTHDSSTRTGDGGGDVWHASLASANRADATMWASLPRLQQQVSVLLKRYVREAVYDTVQPPVTTSAAQKSPRKDRVRRRQPPHSHTHSHSQSYTQLQCRHVHAAVRAPHVACHTHHRSRAHALPQTLSPMPDHPVTPYPSDTDVCVTGHRHRGSLNWHGGILLRLLPTHGRDATSRRRSELPACVSATRPSAAIPSSTTADGSADVHRSVDMDNRTVNEDVEQGGGPPALCVGNGESPPFSALSALGSRGSCWVSSLRVGATAVQPTFPLAASPKKKKGWIKVGCCFCEKEHAKDGTSHVCGGGEGVGCVRPAARLLSVVRADERVAGVCQGTCRVTRWRERVVAVTTAAVYVVCMAEECNATKGLIAEDIRLPASSTCRVV